MQIYLSMTKDSINQQVLYAQKLQQICIFIFLVKFEC